MLEIFLKLVGLSTCVVRNYLWAPSCIKDLNPDLSLCYIFCSDCHLGSSKSSCSSNDVFCNAELKQSCVALLGDRCDMFRILYTICTIFCFAVIIYLHIQQDSWDFSTYQHSSELLNWHTRNQITAKCHQFNRQRLCTKTYPNTTKPDHAATA